MSNERRPEISAEDYGRTKTNRRQRDNFCIGFIICQILFCAYVLTDPTWLRHGACEDVEDNSWQTPAAKLLLVGIVGILSYNLGRFYPPKPHFEDCTYLENGKASENNTAEKRKMMELLKKTEIAHELTLCSKHEQGKIVGAAICAAKQAVGEANIAQAAKKVEIEKERFWKLIKKCQLEARRLEDLEDEAIQKYGELDLYEEKKLES